MYFSNIGNDELQHFHGTIGADFNISLTEILTSDLFDVETIIPDKLFRVYPLFYCREILSSNPADKILDNRCLIVTRETHETYFAFTSNGTKTVLNEAVLNIFERDTDLNEDDFNALVYMLRRIGIIARDFNIENNPIITGNYGTYIFQNTDGLRNDTGLIINDALKTTAPLMITLKNPFFLNAKYTLTFTVRSLTGANVCLDEYEDYRVTDTFNIVLTENMPVAVDLSNYVNDAVIDFNIGIQVSFDIPEIVNTNFELELTSNGDVLPLNTELVLTAKLTGEDNVEGYNILFYENDVLIGTGVTNSQGIGELHYNNPVYGNNIYSCKCMGLSESISVRIGKYNTNLTLETNKNIVYIPNGSYKISGTLTSETEIEEYVPVMLYDNNVPLGLTYLYNGHFSIKYDNLNEPAVHNYKIVYEGSEITEPSESDIVTVTVRKINTNLTLNYTFRPVGGGAYRFDFSGRLTNEFNEPLVNTNVNWGVVGSNDSPGIVTTDNNGEYSFSNTYGIGIFGRSMQVTYNGDETHNKGVITVQINR